MSQFLTNVGLMASQNPFLAYFIIYLATIFLGNISAFAAFWIILHGFFGWWGFPVLLLTIFAADMSGDLLWYSLGLKLRDTKLGNFIKNRLPQHEKLEVKIHKNAGKLVIVSKFFYASAFPVIFLVGWCHIGFKKFFKSSILSILIWLPILTGLAFGLISGLSPLRAVSVFKRFEVVFFVGLGLFLVADYFLAKMLKRIFGNGNGNGSGNGNWNGNINYGTEQAVGAVAKNPIPLNEKLPPA